jgi:two-component sensor histidine kinase
MKKTKNKIEFKITLNADDCRALTRAMHEAQTNAIKEHNTAKAEFYTRVRDSLIETVQSNKEFG